jgi:N-acetylmuramoyl-L-alanine amidase
LPGGDGSCSRQPRYVVDDPETLSQLEEAWTQRKDFPPLNQLDYYLPLYSKYLKDVKICLDPGHGGDADQPRYKRGPTDYRAS